MTLGGRHTRLKSSFFLVVNVLEVNGCSPFCSKQSVFVVSGWMRTHFRCFNVEKRHSTYVLCLFDKSYDMSYVLGNYVLRLTMTCLMFLGNYVLRLSQHMFYS